ncbi:Glycogen debranching enzyme [Roseimaritima multifibrata]|uniref:Glycogen debranching enzyme n=1 Tax=Roseimaritima multifibrata TaxID=1930274 RepID=A0A517MHV0_9BACT|nr:glycogen debranching protein GlgX [Roseimaritima multifibrata]QDS94458.1 Glycogen debranching enzyme [Roseimaritima multifibrata]
MQLPSTTHSAVTPAFALGPSSTPDPVAFKVEAGSPHPLGPTIDDLGVNFSIYSEHATSVELLLFRNHDDRQPCQIIQLDPAVNKSFHLWHAYVCGLKPGFFYAYRVDGPQEVHNGHRFQPSKVLIDPYARGISKAVWNRGDACGDKDNLETSLRCAIVHDNYDWEDDKPLNQPTEELVIYEMHVGGFTKSDSSGVAYPGTFRGVIEKIPYLQELGINAVELLPVFEYDDVEVLRTVDGSPKTNYWGYSTMAFFAPHSSYCESPSTGQHVHEFCDMVKALHKAGISVILDVVFNHTDEGNHMGPTYSFKGIDNSTYYHLVPGQEQYYNDFSGCGNTLRCNHPVGEKFIVDCLEYWVETMHVDGFRFDEASVLTRGEGGVPLEKPPLIWNVELSDKLSQTKMIAEAWDAAGLYQVGYFPGERWAEWNGKFRDDVRDFVKGEPGQLGSIAKRLAGSADLYQSRSHEPVNSVNFINCHDGFTMNDLVSYNGKHNGANGEGNRDGVNDNASWNCGWEGATTDAAVEQLRERQIKNFATILMVSQGVPMFVAGDEHRRTQKGNNNAYCQDNELNWVDWNLLDQEQSMFRFWKRVIAFRKQHQSLHRARYFTGDVNQRGIADIAWHGPEINQPGWHDPCGRALALTLGGFDAEDDLHIMLNMHWEELAFELPCVAGRTWRQAINTALPSPEDICEYGKEVSIANEKTFHVSGRSIAVLVSK